MIFIYSALYTFSECCTNMIYNALEQERSHYFLAWGFCSLIPYLCDALRLVCPAAQLMEQQLRSVSTRRLGVTFNLLARLAY
jgi:hypothetical protein